MHRITLLVAFALAGAAFAQDFGALEKNADEVAVITLDSGTLRALLRACSSDDQDTRETLRILAGISGIQVRSLAFHDGDMPADDEIAALRSRLIPAGWPRFLSSRSKDPAETTEGYWAPDGLALLTWEPGEITWVRIKGSLSLNDLPSLGHKFGLPALRQGIGIQPLPDHLPVRAITPSSTAEPEKLSFSAMVRDIEARQGIRHLHIPLLGLIKPVSYMASAGGVRALDLAVFENAPSTFVGAVAASVPNGWSPVVEVREGVESTRVWLGDAGHSLRLVIATHDGSDGVLLTTKVNVQQLEQGALAWGHPPSNDR